MPHQKYAPTPDYALAEKLLQELKDKHWSDEPQRKGMHTSGYMPAEQEAIDIVVKEAVEKQGMKALSDLAGNVYLIKEGKNTQHGRPTKTDVIVSHLDTVEKGGAHDGRDGIAAGIAVVAGFNRAKITPDNDICVMIARSEESCINGQVSIGSKLATGQLSAAQLGALYNRQNEETVFSNMANLGIPVMRLNDKLDAGPTLFPTQNDAKSLIGFLAEAHIEQGNYCAKQDVTIGIVNSIRGNTRFLNGIIKGTTAQRGKNSITNATIKGEAAHSGATFPEDRADAIVAFAELIHAANEWARQKQAEGANFVFSPSVVSTTNTSPTTVAANAKFSLDYSTSNPELSTEFNEFLNAKSAELQGANKPGKLKITLPPSNITTVSHRISEALPKDQANTVIAFAELIHAANDWTKEKQSQGHDLVFTPAVVSTTQASPTTTKFSLEIRSAEKPLLKEFATFLQGKSADIQHANKSGQLKITLPEPKFTDPAAMDKSVISHAQTVAAKLGLKPGIVTSGAGHDTAMFANTGTPSVMIFIKQDDPISHNPRESRNKQSFDQACDLLAGMIATPMKREHVKAPSGAKSFTQYLRQHGAGDYTAGQWKK